MLKTKHVENFFQLYLNSSNITSLMLVDAISFYSGNKSCLRLILDKDEYSIFKSLHIRSSYHHVAEPMKSDLEGNSWYSLAKENLDSVCDRYLIVLSHDKNYAADCLDAEINGDTRKAGLYFDYPSCCIDYYNQVLQVNPELWAVKIHESSGNGPYPYQANRLATGWGGIAFTAELFPCSLFCENAIKIGETNEQSLKKLGLSKLAEKIMKHSLSSCILNRNGSVNRLVEGRGIKDHEILLDFYKE